MPLLLGYDATSDGFGFLEDETTTLSRNVGKQLPSDEAPFRRTNVSTKQLRNLNSRISRGCLSTPTPGALLKILQKHIVVHCLCLRLPKVASQRERERERY